MRKMIFFALTFLFVCVTGCGNELNNQRTLNCTFIKAIECDRQECTAGTAESFGIPQTLTINFKDKIITGIGKDKIKKTTEIQNMVSVEDRVMLHGVQNGKAWSMVIEKGTGEITLAVSDKQSGFLVFGSSGP